MRGMTWDWWSITCLLGAGFAPLHIDLTKEILPSCILQEEPSPACREAAAGSDSRQQRKEHVDRTPSNPLPLSVHCLPFPPCHLASCRRIHGTPTPTPLLVVAVEMGVELEAQPHPLPRYEPLPLIYDLYISHQHWSCFCAACCLCDKLFNCYFMVPPCHLASCRRSPAQPAGDPPAPSHLCSSDCLLVHVWNRMGTPGRHCQCPQPSLPDEPEGGMDKPVCLSCNRRLCWLGEEKGLCECKDPVSVPDDNKTNRISGLDRLCGRCGSFLSSRKREQLQGSSQRSA